MHITLHAKSSSGDTYYEVNFHHEENKLKVFCSCAAGELGRFCKHKWQLLSGNADMLQTPEQEEQLQQVLPLVEQSDFKHLYDRVNELELEQAAIKKQIKAEKKKVEQRMREGF